jgi:hypothetical protein
VFVDDGELVSDCTSGAPATVTVTELGAPIDLPVTVEIAFAGASGVALDDPHFTPSECATIVSDFECEMARTARTFFSNYSSVLINEFFAPPLWQTGRGVDGTPPAAGTPLAFELTTSFDGDSGNLCLETTAVTTVQAWP